MNSLTCYRHYKTALNEYCLSQDSEHLKELSGKMQIPVELILHSPQRMIEEIKYYGQVEEEVADKIENLWGNIMRDMLMFSHETHETIAEKSSHYIHLSDFELVEQKISQYLII